MKNQAGVKVVTKNVKEAVRTLKGDNKDDDEEEEEEDDDDKGDVVVELDMMNAYVDDEGAKAIAGALKSNRTLTSLELRGDQVGAEAARAINYALKPHGIFTILDLQGSFSNEKKIGDEGAKALGEALKWNGSLTSLNLRGNKIGAEGATAIAEALNSNGTLISLELTGNKIGDEGSKAIGEALKSNGTLTSLDLGSNKVGAEGAKVIGEALKANKTLTSLRLPDNQIDDEGAKAIGEALKSNGTLSTLNLQKNRIGDEGAIALFCSFKQRGSNASDGGNELKLKLSNKVPATIKASLQLPTPALEMIKRLIEDGNGNFAMKISEMLGTAELNAFAKGWHQTRRHNMDLSMPPEWVISRGAANIESFFNALTSQGLNQDYQQQLIILGNASAGKTSLLNSLRNGEPSLTTSGPERATLSVEAVSWEPQLKLKSKLKSKPMPKSEPPRISIVAFDFGGQKDYLVTHTLFYSSRATALLLFNIEDFSKNTDKFDEMFEDRILFWFYKIRSFAPGALILLVATHCTRASCLCPGRTAYKEAAICKRIRTKLESEMDEEAKQLEKRRVEVKQRIERMQHYLDDDHQSYFKAAKRLVHTRETLKAVELKLAHRPTCSGKVIRTSSRTGFGLKELEQAILTRVEQTAFQLPQSYVNLNEKLAQKAAEMMSLSGSQLPMLRLKEVEAMEAELVGTTNPTGNVEHALESLHDFGSIVYYPGKEPNKADALVFPNPSALADALRQLVRHDMVVGSEGGDEPYLLRVIRRANEQISDPSQRWDERQIIEQVRRSSFLPLELLKHFDVWEAAWISGTFQELLALVQDLDFTLITKGSDGKDCILLHYYPVEPPNDDSELDSEIARLVEIQQPYKAIGDWRYHFNGYIPSGLFQRLLVRFHLLNPREVPEDDFQVFPGKQQLFSKMKSIVSASKFSSSSASSSQDKIMVEAKVVDNSLAGAAASSSATEKELILRLHVPNEAATAMTQQPHSNAYRKREAWELFRNHVRSVESILAETPGLCVDRLAVHSPADASEPIRFRIEECVQKRVSGEDKIFTRPPDQRRSIGLDSLIGPPTSTSLVLRSGAKAALPRGFVNHILLIGSEENGSHQIQLLANEFRFRGFVVDIALSAKQVRGQVGASFCIAGFLTKGTLQLELFQLVLAEGIKRGRYFVFLYEKDQSPSAFTFSEIAQCSKIIRPIVEQYQSKIVYTVVHCDRRLLRTVLNSIAEGLLLRIDSTMFREIAGQLDSNPQRRLSNGPITYLSPNDFDRATWRQCREWLDRALPDQQTTYSQNPMEAKGFLVETLHPLPADDLVFHGFLSHYQGTGGGQCHVLFTELERRGLKMWYRMNQQDRHAKGMARGVNHSAWYLLFLSKEVFTRKFVLLELACALTTNKPIILVYEDGIECEKFDFATWGTSDAENARKIPDEVKFLIPDLLQVKPCYKRSELIALQNPTQHSKCDELKSYILSQPKPGNKLDVDQTTKQWNALWKYIESRVGNIPQSVLSRSHVND